MKPAAPDYKVWIYRLLFIFILFLAIFFYYKHFSGISSPPQSPSLNIPSIFENTPSISDEYSAHGKLERPKLVKLPSMTAEEKKFLRRWGYIEGKKKLVESGQLEKIETVLKVLRDPKILESLRKKLSITLKEEKYLKKYGYIEAYQVSVAENESNINNDEQGRIKDILEIMRAPKKVAEGIVIRADHGMNGGAFDLKMDNGRKLKFYWSGSWGHPTLIMEGNGPLPDTLKAGQRIKVYYIWHHAEKNGTAVGIFRE